jgi:hypothetical protein
MIMRSLVLSIDLPQHQEAGTRQFHVHVVIGAKYHISPVTQAYNQCMDLRTNTALDGTVRENQERDTWVS